MDMIPLSILPIIVPVAIGFYCASRRVKCPDCGDRLPFLLSPFKKTRRMWRAGGYFCARCGCETNMAGQKVTADTTPAPFPTLACALVTVSLLVGVGLTAVVFVRIERPVVDVPLTALELEAPRPPAILPPKIEAPPPPVFAPPQEAAVLAPVN